MMAVRFETWFIAVCQVLRPFAMSQNKGTFMVQKILHQNMTLLADRQFETSGEIV